MWGEPGKSYQFYVHNGGIVNATITSFMGEGAWRRYTATFTPVSTTTFYIRFLHMTSGAGTFYLDGLQLEEKDHPTTFVDPDATPPPGFVSNGCSWNGPANASTSTRSATSRNGGRILDLYDDYYFRVEQPIGIGAPDVENYETPYANPAVSGQMNQGTRELARLIQLSGTLEGSSYQSLLSRRDALARLVKPNLTSDNEPLWWQFSGGASPVEIAARYAGGLSGGVLSGFTERISLRLVADKPEWQSVEHD